MWQPTSILELSVVNRNPGLAVVVLVVDDVVIVVDVEVVVVDICVVVMMQ